MQCKICIPKATLLTKNTSNIIITTPKLALPPSSFSSFYPLPQAPTRVPFHLISGHFLYISLCISQKLQPFSPYIPHLMIITQITLITLIHWDYILPPFFSLLFFVSSWVSFGSESCEVNIHVMINMHFQFFFFFFLVLVFAVFDFPLESKANEFHIKNREI